LLEPTAAVGPRAAVFFRAEPRGRAQMFAITDAEPRAMWVVDADGGGSLGRGQASPMIAPDGRHLAYFDRGKLWVAAPDGTAKQQVTRHRADQVSVLVAAFTPDGAALLFHQDAVESEEGVALPKGVTPGFHRFDLATGTTTPIPGLEAFSAWADDGRVLYERTGPDRKDVLVRASLSPVVEEVLMTAGGDLGFAQLTVWRDVVVWGEHHAPGRGRMFAARLDGSRRRMITPETAWAQVQWPRFAPDGAQLAYTDDSALMRISLVGPEPMPAPDRLTVCADRCQYHWEGSRSLLVRDGDELARVPLGDAGGGVRTTVAADVVGFAVAGEPD
jgi:Tol biopolymer transport system component